MMCSLIFNFFWAECAFLAHVVLGGVIHLGDQSEDTHSDLRLLSPTPAFQYRPKVGPHPDPKLCPPCLSVQTWA